MRANKEMIMREIAGETVLIPTGQTAMRLHGMISLSESGAMLWKMLKDEPTVQEMVQAVLTEYDIDAVTAKKDVEAFVQQMQDVGILEE